MQDIKVIIKLRKFNITDLSRPDFLFLRRLRRGSQFTHRGVDVARRADTRGRRRSWHDRFRRRLVRTIDFLKRP